jgi:hypothetical protein
MEWAIVVMVIIGFVLWIWALVDCLQVPDDSLYRTGTS